MPTIHEGGSFETFNDPGGNPLIAINRDGTVSTLGIDFADGTKQVTAATGSGGVVSVFGSTGTITTLNNPSFTGVTSIANGSDAGAVLVIGTPLGAPVDKGGILMTGTNTEAPDLEIHNIFSAGIQLFTHSNSNFRAPSITLNRSEGTQVTPTILTNGDSLGYIEFAGFHDGMYDNNAFLMQVLATENWTSSAQGCRLDIYCTPNGQPTSNNIKAMTIGGDAIGTVTVGRNLSVGGNSAGGGLILPLSSSPTSVATAGITGQIAWDATKFYVCTAGGAAGAATWKATALSAV
jgi:hypothetical protein